MPLATIRPMGESGLYHIHFLDASERPDHSLPGGGRPVDPGYGVGGGAHAGQLPSHGGAHPGQLPSHGSSGIPDNTLPSERPPVMLPGYYLVLVRDQAGMWRYAAIAPGSPPPRPLPTPIPPGGAPDQGLPPQPPVGPDQGLPPGSAGAPDQTLPPSGAPPVAGQPLPPTAPAPTPTPQRR
jgi:hypothetical protein